MYCLLMSVDTKHLLVIRSWRHGEWQLYRHTIQISILCSAHHGWHLFAGIWTIQVHICSWYFKLHVHVVEWSHEWELASNAVAWSMQLIATAAHCRWVCTSADPEDLAETDRIASTVLQDLIAKEGWCHRNQKRHLNTWLFTKSHSVP